MIINLKLTFYNANKNAVTKKEIAEATGVSKQMVSHWFAGRSKPNEKHSKIISDLFKSKGAEPVFNE